MSLDTKELARRGAIYASLADSMVASVIEELSPKDQQSKLLREKLATIQEAQVAAVSASFAAASNLQLLRWDALLKNFGFQPQVLSTVRTAPFEGSHILGLEPKVLQQRVQTIRQADRMAGSSVTFVQKPKESNQTSTKKTSSTKKSQQCLSAWVRLLLRPCRGPNLKISRFVLVLAEEPVTDPSQDNVGRLGQLLQLPPPASFDGVQVGARLADFSPQWRSLLGSCRATITVEDGVGIVFLQQPQLTHQCISFRTRNCCQDLQQAVDALLAKGAIERVNDETSLGFYSRLFLVPKKTGDLRPIIDLSTLNQHMVVPHFKMETQWSVRSAIRSQEWTVSIDIRDAYLHVLMHKAVRKYLRFMVNKRIYQFTCLPFGLATSPQEFTKLLRPVKKARYQPTHLLGRLADLCRYSRTGPAACPDDHQFAPVSRLDHQLREVRSDTQPGLWGFMGMQFNTRQFTVVALPKMRLKVQSVHQHWMTNPVITARDLHRLLGILVFMATLVPQGRLRLRPVQWWAPLQLGA